MLSHFITCCNLIRAMILDGVSVDRRGTYQRRNSPSSKGEVFILGYSIIDTSSDVSLLGTAFSISNDRVVTAYHVLTDDITKQLLHSSFLISRTVTRDATNGNHIFDDDIEVKLVIHDVDNDWAILAILDPAKRRQNWYSLCPHQDLPPDPIDDTYMVKAFFAPIGLYLSNNYPSMHIWADEFHRVMQYLDPQNIIVNGGFYAGTCGSPYLNENGYVVGMHTESMHEGKDRSLVPENKRRRISITERLDKLESESIDLASIHGSVRQAVVLSNIQQFIHEVSHFST